MRLLRSLDLYKVVILLSVVLLPALGWWCYQLDQDIELSRKAIRDAEGPNGMLVEIGKLQKRVDLVVANRTSTSDTINQPRRYFEQQILQAGGSSMKSDDFGIPNDPKEEITTLPGSKQRVADYVLEVRWQKEDFAVPLDFVYAVLFNCESGAGASGGAAGQSIWKLRDLDLVNATDHRVMSGYKTPPPELGSNWLIREMRFARREPRKAN